MARHGDPVRIETARREATIARLVSAGRSPSAAADLVGEWEAIQAASGRVPDRSDWERFDAWLASRRSGN